MERGEEDFVSGDGLDSNGEFPIQTTLNLVDCLQEKAAAIAASALESRNETVFSPRNLITAYHRIERHIEIFMRVTDETRTRMEGDSDSLSEIKLLRRECAQRLQAVENALGCQSGALPPELRTLGQAECKERLTEAANLAAGLAKSFLATRKKFDSGGGPEVTTDG